MKYALITNHNGLFVSLHDSREEALNNLFDSLARGMTLEELEAVPGNLRDGIEHMIEEIYDNGGTFEYAIQEIEP